MSIISRKNATGTGARVTAAKTRNRLVRPLVVFVLLAAVGLVAAGPSLASGSLFTSVSEFFGIQQRMESAATAAPAVLATTFSVTPANTNVTTGAVQSYAWTFTAIDSGNTTDLQMTVPAAWTAPQLGAGAGQVTTTGSNCAGALSVSGQVVTVVQAGSAGNGKCQAGEVIVINYLGVTAPAAAVYTFTTNRGAAPTVTVNPAGVATTTTVMSSASPSTYGQNVTFTANVSPTPTGGTVNFVIDGNLICPSVPVDGSGNATCAINTLNVAMSPHSVVANYSGFTGFLSSSGSLGGGHTVNKATVNIDAFPDTKVFGSSDPVSFLFTYNAFVLGENEMTALVTGAPSCTRAAGENVGTYLITCTAGTLMAPNYTFATGATANFTITPAGSTTTVTCPPGPYTYTGSPIVPPCTYSVTGNEAGNPVLASGNVAPAGHTNNVNAGMATASFTFTGDPNHTGSMGSANFTIDKANATCTITGYTENYDGNPHTATGQCTGVGGPMDVLAGLDLSGTTHTLPGVYNDTWTFTDVTGNYNNTSGMVTDTIILCPNIETPDIDTKTNVPVSVPVITSPLPPAPIIGTDFVFTYDPAVIYMDPNPLVITVTPGPLLSMSAVITVNKTTPGTVIVGIADPGFTMGGTGPLVYLNFTVTGPIGSQSPLNVSNFRYNGGSICLGSITNGTLTVISGATSGQVTYENLGFPVANPVKPVPGAFINATAVPPPTSVSDTTDSSGNYLLDGFGIGPYTVNASKPAYPFGTMMPNGIFSNDSSLIAQHVVGLITLGPTQIQAGTVNTLGLPMSSFDAALIAQWSVGINNGNNRTGTWRFTPNNTMPDVTLDNVQNYTALLYGDVNGDWDNLGARPAPMLSDPERIRNAVQVTAGEHLAAPGSVVTVPVRVENLRGRAVDSYQFDIEYDARVLSPAQVAASLEQTLGGSLSVAANSPEPGVLKVFVYGAVPAMGDGVYVNLRFNVIGAAGTSSPLTIQGFRFNNGKDDVYPTEGILRVTRATRGNDASPIDQ